MITIREQKLAAAIINSYEKHCSEGLFYCAFCGVRVMPVINYAGECSIPEMNHDEACIVPYAKKVILDLPELDKEVDAVSAML